MNERSVLAVNQELIVSDPTQFEQAKAAATTTTPTSEPADITASRTAAFDAVPEGYHQLRAGETLYDVAFRYNITQNELRSWNNLAPTETPPNGKILIVNRALAQSISRVKERPSTAPRARYHEVKSGETLFRIAGMYGVKVPDIVGWNNLKGNTISVGQQLVVGYTPGVQETAMTSVTTSSTTTTTTTTTATPTAAGPQYHTVASGETLFAISRKYGTTPAELQRLNNKQGTQISVGEKLRVK